MPPSLVSIAAIVCESILQDKEGIITAFRIVDVFKFPPVEDLPIQYQRLGMTLLIVGKLIPGDRVDHHITIKVINPRGEAKAVGENIQVPKSELKYPSSPVGFNVIVNTAMRAKAGLYYFAIFFDGEEVTRTPITLVEEPVVSSEPPQS